MWVKAEEQHEVLHLLGQGHLKQDCPKAKENMLGPVNLNVANAGDATHNNLV